MTQYIRIYGQRNRGRRVQTHDGSKALLENKREKELRNPFRGEPRQSSNYYAFQPWKKSVNFHAVK